jgi:hypothetical protein
MIEEYLQEEHNLFIESEDFIKMLKELDEYGQNIEK